MRSEARKTSASGSAAHRSIRKGKEIAEAMAKYYNDNLPRGEGKHPLVFNRFMFGDQVVS